MNDPNKKKPPNKAINNFLLAVNPTVTSPLSIYTSSLLFYIFRFYFLEIPLCCVSSKAYKLFPYPLTAFLILYYKRLHSKILPYNYKFIIWLPFASLQLLMLNINLNTTIIHYLAKKKI